MRDSLAHRRFGLVVAMWACMWVAISAQRTSTPGSAAAVQRGRQTFQNLCAACHGEAGKGDGPVAAALRQRPSDLTTLAKSKGSFPAARIAAILKGTEPVIAHGSVTMMTWGSFFNAAANGNQAVADARIADVVKFIESLQVN